MRKPTVTTAAMLLAIGVAAPAWSDDQATTQGQKAAPKRNAQPAQQGGDHARETGRKRMIGSSLADIVFTRLAEREALWNIDVRRTSPGRMTLSGTAPSEAAKDRALRIARRTPGVIDVRDEIRVEPAVRAQQATPQVTDRVLAQRVATRIARAIPGAKAGEDWWLRGWRVEGQDNRWNMVVEATDGAIILEGDIPSHGIARQAVEAARKTEGVRSVQSDLDLFGYAAYPYGPYPHRYASFAHPYAVYDGDYYVSTDVGERGVHVMTGDVTRIDHRTGKLSLRTHEGTLDLHFPPQSLKNVAQGDRLTVELGFVETSAPAASPAISKDVNRSRPPGTGPTERK